jgi:hypothetical protein
MDLIAAFRLFIRTLPIHFALLGRNRKYIKSKTTAKLKEKEHQSPRSETYCECLTFSRTPLLSRCRLPFSGNSGALEASNGGGEGRGRSQYRLGGSKWRPGGSVQ